jgi:hypothetical protein
MDLAASVFAVDGGEELDELGVRVGQVPKRVDNGVGL